MKQKNDCCTFIKRFRQKFEFTSSRCICEMSTREYYEVTLTILKSVTGLLLLHKSLHFYGIYDIYDII